MHNHSSTQFFIKTTNPLIKFVIFALLSISFMLIDSRFNYLSIIRSSIAFVLYPTQQVIAVVPKTVDKINSYSRNYIDIIAENKNLHEQLTHISINNYQTNKLIAENQQLRTLLDLKQNSKTKLLVSEILYSSNNPFMHKLILNKGSIQGVLVGQPVINEYGVLGQVTKIFSEYSEVTLISDKQIMVPIQIMRNSLKGISYGTNMQNKINLNFIPYNSDVLVGDTLITSGLDGVYPIGLAVAHISKIGNKTSDGFMQIECVPSANIINKPYVMVILNQPLAISLEKIIKN